MKTSRLIPTAALFVALASPRRGAAVLPSAPLFSRLAGPVSVPAESSDHALFVTAKINGHGPFRLLVDTGSSVSLLSPAAAEAAGASAAAEPCASLNGFGDEVDLETVVLRTLELGGAQFEGVPAALSSDVASIGRATGQRVDGVLGFSVFADIVVALDFPGRRLVLDQSQPKDLPPMRAELDLRAVDEVPCISARLQGNNLTLLVDTGSNRGLQLPPALAREADWRAEPRPGPLVSVLGERGREMLGRLAGELHLDRVTQIEPVAAITEGPASIGVGFLQHFCVVFDASHDKLWLCSRGDDPVPAPPARSLGLSLLADAAGWRVVGTIPGSPAEGAGIAAGDVVTQIEGKPAARWSRDAIDGWTDEHKQVALTVVHDSSRREVVLPVWPLVP